MDQQSMYKYKRLDEPSAIRLLVMKPSDDLDAKVECSIVHATLSAYEDAFTDYYVALSYVWGDATIRKDISIDGADFSVTANLESALRHVRDPSVELKIWADAVCINQANKWEKAVQVDQMGDVYKLARQTVIHLGDPTKESDLFLGYVQSSNSKYKTAKGPSYKDNTISYWSSILGCGWFQRIWTFQELILSKDPWIQRGQIRVRWGELANTVKAIRDAHESQYYGSDDEARKPKLSDEAKESLKIFSSMHERWEEYQNCSGEKFWTNANDLVTILEERRGLGITQPADMLFAHLGIVRLSYNPLVEVNYGKDVADVYEDLATYLLINYRYDILSHREFAVELNPPQKALASSRRKEDLATWAPVWTEKKQSHPYLGLRDALVTHSRHSPSKDDSFSEFEKACQKLAPAVVGCAGFRVAEIFNVSSVITSSQASFRIEDFESLDPDFKVTYAGGEYHRNFRLVQKAWKLVYEHWRDIIEPLLVDRNVSGYSEATMNIRRKSKYVPFSKAMLDDVDLLYPSRYEAKYPDIYAIKEFYRSGHGPSRIAFRRLASYLIAHAIPEKYHSTPFLHGRRFACLKDGTLCLVPASALPGDVACFFFGYKHMPFVVRPMKDFKAPEEGLLSNPSVLENFPDFEINKVQHCTFVGQCWVDKWMDHEQFHRRKFFLGIQPQEALPPRADPEPKKSGWKKLIKWGGRRKDDEVPQTDDIPDDQSIWSTHFLDNDKDLWLDGEVFALH
ncbi:heterokaryon incompatibility protein-domain-containing protein [Rhexocercosporidium sp. MPI-PUGE-AT-0058]|nr:heterokaryon incompatibility protein-domain-containing protein [Rhexocercosporidium sp. MPI-PUGE-AT-0058]